MLDLQDLQDRFAHIKAGFLEVVEELQRLRLENANQRDEIAHLQSIIKQQAEVINED